MSKSTYKLVAKDENTIAIYDPYDDKYIPITKEEIDDVIDSDGNLYSDDVIHQFIIRKTRKNKVNIKGVVTKKANIKKEYEDVNKEMFKNYITHRIFNEFPQMSNEDINKFNKNPTLATLKSLTSAPKHVKEQLIKLYKNGESEYSTTISSDDSLASLIAELRSSNRNSEISKYKARNIARIAFRDLLNNEKPKDDKIKELKELRVTLLTEGADKEETDMVDKTIKEVEKTEDGKLNDKNELYVAINDTFDRNIKKDEKLDEVATSFNWKLNETPMKNNYVSSNAYNQLMNAESIHGIDVSPIQYYLRVRELSQKNGDKFYMLGDTEELEDQDSYKITYTWGTPNMNQTNTFTLYKDQPYADIIIKGVKDENFNHTKEAIEKFNDPSYDSKLAKVAKEHSTIPSKFGDWEKTNEKLTNDDRTFVNLFQKVEDTVPYDAFVNVITTDKIDDIQPFIDFNIENIVDQPHYNVMAIRTDREKEKEKQSHLKENIPYFKKDYKDIFTEILDEDNTDEDVEIPTDKGSKKVKTSELLNQFSKLYRNSLFIRTSIQREKDTFEKSLYNTLNKFLVDHHKKYPDIMYNKEEYADIASKIDNKTKHIDVDADNKDNQTEYDDQDIDKINTLKFDKKQPEINFIGKYFKYVPESIEAIAEKINENEDIKKEFKNMFEESQHLKSYMKPSPIYQQKNKLPYADSSTNPKHHFYKNPEKLRKANKPSDYDAITPDVFDQVWYEQQNDFDIDKISLGLVKILTDKLDSSLSSILRNKLNRRKRNFSRY